MADPKENRSFWTTLPGILTGIAAILSGIGAVLAVVLNVGGSGGGDKGPTLEAWANQADEICATADDDLRELGGGRDPFADPTLRPQAVRIITRGNEKIVALDRPTEGRESIRQLVALVTRQNLAARNAYAAADRGDSASVQAYQAEATGLVGDISRLYGELGAYACAQVP